MGKRWQNWGVVTEGHCAGADTVTRGEQAGWVAGADGEHRGGS